MAVKLRLRREGTVKRPHYRIVAADSRSPRDGRFLEILGSYHPMQDPSGITVDEERALHWLRHGAQPTEAVEKLLRITGVWEQFKPGDAPKRERGDRGPRLSRKARANAAEAAAAPAEEPAAAEESAPEAAPSEEPAAEEAPAEKPVTDAPDAAEAPSDGDESDGDEKGDA
jgi:small subunit ribosomal protein S16